MPPKHKTSPGRVRRTTAADWKPNKTALITGASGGIGYDLASVFAENGYNVVLVARTREKMLALANQAQQMFGVSAYIIEKDLAVPGAAREVHRELQRVGIEIDILVNNAGFGLLGAFGYSDREEELQMLQLNTMTPVDLTKLFLPAMLLKGQGRILNVASTAGFQPGPYMSNYYATKAYLVSFSIGLAEEVRERGITVSVLCPGPTPTGFRARAGIRRGMLGGLGGVDSRIVARAGFEGLMAGKLIIVPGILNKLAVFATRHAPLGLLSRIIARLQQKRMA